MTDTEQDPRRERLAFFTSTVARETAALYERSRSTAGRLLKGVSMGAAGGLGGFLLGIIAAPRGTKNETEVAYLLRQVRVGQAVRDFAPMVTNMVTSMEYDARKRLEGMGYYPCSDCGVPHTSDLPHDFPAGTYWDAERNVYLQPDNADWTQGGYDAAGDDNRWGSAEDLDEEDDDGEQVH